MKSYTSQQKGLRTFIVEVGSLYRAHLTDVPKRMQNGIREVREFERLLEQRFSLSLKNLDILDIGTGPFTVQMTYFAFSNRAVGIDLDVVPLGWKLNDYVRMLRFNGARRTIKTIGRKLAGIDRDYRRELMKQLNVRALPKLTVLQMDACNMSLRENSFDLAYSRSVLHSVPRPADAIREMYAS